MGIERLELCVRFCNIAGLFPFRMVLNRFNGKFLRFESHWRHPANWWLILSITVHFVQGSFIIYLGLLNLFYNLIRALPTAALVAYVFVFNFVVKFRPVWFYNTAPASTLSTSGKNFQSTQENRSFIL